MRILFLGLPGSGKTTQTNRLLKDIKLPVVSVGAELRKMAEENNEFGKSLKKAVENGDLVSEEIVAKVVEKKLEELNSEKFIVDGYPRTLEQLSYFDPKFDLVFYLNVPKKLAYSRLINRGRMDDKPEIIKHRFEIQKDEMSKLMKYYKQQEILISIDNKQDIEEVHANIKKELDKWSERQNS